jgi:membrane protein DedA with SNARE-associated domain
VESFVQNYGYLALFLLSILSSACVPIPSEVTYVVAGALCTTAVTGHVQLTLWLVVVIATLGSLVGAVIAYEVARSAGRAIVERWGKWILLTHRDLDNAERWFARYGAPAVLVSRVLPVVRSFISVPAGIAEMPRVRFALLTTIGSAAWAALLASLGYVASSHWHRVSADFHDAQYPIIALIVLALAFGLWHRVRTLRRHDAG